MIFLCLTYYFFSTLLIKTSSNLFLFLSKYSFNTHTAKHYFCSKCGIYTHHQRRSDPCEYGVNISCIEGISIEDYLHVGYDDGKNNHPSDSSIESQ